MRQALNLLTVVWMLAMIATAASVARGEDFRIDTDIFIGSSKTPAAEVLTLFHSGNVYDFQLSGSEEITMFEPRRAQLTVIDPLKKRRTTLSTLDLLNAAVSLQTAVVEQRNPNPVFLAAAQPVFEVTSEEIQENGSDFTRLTFAGKPIQYTVTAQKARHPSAANEYRYFSDWSARLSSLRPGSGLPAGARCEVNDALARKGLLPTKVEREIQETPLARAGLLPRKSEVRSQHLVVWALSQEDMKRIDRVGDLLVNTKLVSFEEYCAPAEKPKPVAPPQQQARK